MSGNNDSHALRFSIAKNVVIVTRGDTNLSHISRQGCKLWHSFLSKIFNLNAQFGLVEKSIETDFRSTSSDKNCHQIWQQLQRQGQGATKKGGNLQRNCVEKVFSCHFNDIFLRLTDYKISHSCTSPYFVSFTWPGNKTFQFDISLNSVHSNLIFQIDAIWVQTILITVLICWKPHSLQIILTSFIMAIIRSKSSTISSFEKYLKINTPLSEEGYMYR